MDYAKSYPDERLPSLWFIGDVFREHGLQTKKPTSKTRKQGIVERLRFPIKTITSLGTIQQSVDFVGKKYIAGRSEPVNMFSTCYYQWLKQYKVWRIGSETTDYAISCLGEFWMNHPLSDVVRMDNGMPFRGTGRGSASVSRFVKFLLNLNVTPLFSAPYQSYTNPHIEGNNRTVADLWSATHFTSVDQIDVEFARFNLEHEEFFQWKCKERLEDKRLRYLDVNHRPETSILHSTQGKKIYFIRFVQRWKEQGNQTGIVLLNRFIAIPDAFVGQYVLAYIDLEYSMLVVLEEHNGIASTILEIPYPYSL